MKNNFIPYTQDPVTIAEALKRSREYRAACDLRRTVRDYSSQPVPREIIENVIMTASSAPSGAHKQPWTFCAVSEPGLKAKIREAAEQEEYENYHGRMSEEWLADLAPIGTDWHKEFLEIAPWLIIVFKQSYALHNGEKKKHYYVNESIGLACGFLLAAIHRAGLVALTHTPSPMNFLERILNRPSNERAFLLIPVGFPADNATVPDLVRKDKTDVIEFFE